MHNDLIIAQLNALQQQYEIVREKYLGKDFVLRKKDF